MASIHGLDTYLVNLNNNLDANPLVNIFYRLRTKKELRIKVQDLISYIESKNITNIYLSNAEGYVSNNIIFFLRKKFPSIKFIALQHGLFPLIHSRYKESLRKIINQFGYLISGIFVLGEGFGGIKLNKYYVYSDRERNFLIDKKGWDMENVEVNIRFIKAELYNRFLKNKNIQNEKTALFLLQGLSIVGLCSKQNELFLIESTIKYLSKTYKELLIKEHPSCEGRLETMNLPQNTKIVSSINEGFEKSKTAYSFFSSSLIDAKVYNIKTVGIYSERINVDEEIYENFDKKINFEDIIDS
ncbi:hypothetical protein [Arenibacter arenosicollis]|nr:hypothetical protein [Arenibacter arenosicollis]